MKLRVLGIAALVLVVGGIALIATGSILPGILVLLAGIAAGLLAAAVSVVRGLVERLRDAYSFARAGKPRSARVLSVSGPTGFLAQRVSMQVEVVDGQGVTRHFDHDIPVPFMYGWLLRLARRTNLPFADRLDPERLTRSLEQRALEFERR